ncbi:hypothetical protein [Jatrophihabitans sp.]|uniref:hypothetical protein n=1 Tax=Jatrophihabitans sp. TaxID=1932789 RepID=UPI0030C6E838|nr:hypothetical protein [Jatrophihabitans sp.]
MGFRSTLRRRRQSILAVVTALAVFALVLFLWIGRGPSGDGPAIAIPSNNAPSGATLPSDEPLPSSSGSPSATGSGSASGSGSAAPIGGAPLQLPPFSSDINAAGASTHVVTMSITSDTTILQTAFAIKGGKTASGYHTYVKSPFGITEVAHGDGIVAELAAQSSPKARSITCTLTVDGVTSTHTAKGGFQVVLCLG